MYWWIGSAMRPRPAYVSAAPFTASSLARPVERVAVDRAHRDDAHAVAAPHRDLDRIARAPGPQLDVEGLPRLDGHAVEIGRASCREREWTWSVPRREWR